MLRKIFFFNLISVAFLIGCSDSNTSQTSETVWEQKAQMLENWADNFILPNYESLLDNLLSVEESISVFNNNPTQQHLDNVRYGWLEAYKSWQYVEMFNIGPAEQTFYHLKMNVFPTSVVNIEQLVASGDYFPLDNSPYNSAQGFPALDYLLYGLSQNDSEIILTYSIDGNYRNYLAEIIQRMISNTSYVLDQWSSYRTNFISSTENTATSSANKMTNDFIYYYEKGFRANKFGIPVGVFSAGNVFPEKVEAYFSQNVSRALALEAINAIDLFFNGNGSYSLKQFIDNFATDEMSNLSTEINDQFDLARASIEGLDQNFVNQLNTDFLQMGITYDVIQAGTVLLKTDMLSVLQIATDYIDADGD